MLGELSENGSQSLFGGIPFPSNGLVSNPAEFWEDRGTWGPRLILLVSNGSFSSADDTGAGGAGFVTKLVSKGSGLVGGPEEVDTEKGSAEVLGENAEENGSGLDRVLNGTGGAFAKAVSKGSGADERGGSLIKLFVRSNKCV